MVTFVPKISVIKFTSPSIDGYRSALTIVDVRMNTEKKLNLSINTLAFTSPLHHNIKKGYKLLN